MGTSEFSASILRELADSPHRPALVVSRPDRRQGRGRRLAPPPVIATARELAIETFQPTSVNSAEAIARIAQARPQWLALCAFGALIKEPLLSQFGPILNVHPSLLPRWRGAAPVERAILAGDTRTGVSIMQLTAGLDSGPVSCQEAVAIAADDDYGSLAAKLQSVGARLLVAALDAEAGTAPALHWQVQDERDVSYAEKLTGEDRRIDPLLPAADCERRVRALTPHIGAYLERPDGSRLGVWQARAVKTELGLRPGELDLTPSAGHDPVLQTVDGGLALLQVQPAGRKRMSGADFLRGHAR